MSLISYCPHSFGHVQPSMERCMLEMMNETMREMNRPLRWIAPYWSDIDDIQKCNIGNALGKMVDDQEKFAVEIDVTQFRPNELKVNIRENELTIEGHHKERTDDNSNGTIERHFIRKYNIPEDTQLDTIESHLSDKGILSVSAKKLPIDGKTSRQIPIQAAPRHHEEAKKEEETNK